MASLQINNQLIDKSYQKDKSSSYQLYAELSNISIKLLVLDISSTTFIAFSEFFFKDVNNDFKLSKQLSEFIANDDLFNQNYQAIYFSYINNRATLVPNAIFQAESLKDYHKFNFTTNEDENFYFDNLINLGAKNVYGVNNCLTQLFTNKTNIHFKHFSSSLIEATLANAKTNNALSSLYVNVLHRSFQIIVINNRQLALYNSFNYQAKEDVIYYLLFVMEQLNINNEESTITLSGNINKQDELYLLFSQYIKNLNFITYKSNIKRSYIFEELPVHHHFGLFNLYLCE